jgi:hypothetical protein
MNTYFDYVRFEEVSDIEEAKARITTTESVVANINGKTQAYISKTANVPGASAAIVLNAVNDAGQATSDIALVAGRIQLRNNDANGALAPGGIYVGGGKTIVDGTLIARNGVLVGNALLSYQIASFDRSVTDGTPVSFGVDLGRAPSVSFGPCPVALNAGEVWQPVADNLTSTGFTPRLRILSAPQSASQSTGAFSNTGTSQFDADRSAKPNASDGKYTFTVNLQAQAYAYGSGRNEIQR